MKLDTLKLLVEPDEIHGFVSGLWSDGPIRRSHESGGLVHRVVDRFARRPRIFYEPSDVRIEWTHFSAWWGAILLCDYPNPAVRDLRYLHEIYHAATMPYVAGGNPAVLEVKNFQNEREASTFTEMAIYCELPELRATTFDHPIFVDRFLFPEGDFTRPEPRLIERWQSERSQLFQELMHARTRVVVARPHEVDTHDPQIVWLRRYAEQGANWVAVWRDRFQLVEDAMIALRERTAAGDRSGAAQRHVDWLLSPEIAGGGTIPFAPEAERFRAAFDRLIATYEAAMTDAGQTAVRHSGGEDQG